MQMTAGHVVTASSAESEISNVATPVSNFESLAQRSATRFSKSESKLRNCYCVPGNLPRHLGDAFTSLRNAISLSMPCVRRRQVAYADSIPGK